MKFEEILTKEEAKLKAYDHLVIAKNHLQETFDTLVNHQLNQEADEVYKVISALSNLITQLRRQK